MPSALAIPFQFAPASAPPSTYTTTFPADENPISESGNWARAANSMTNVRTVSGTAYGTQTDDTYDDSYAILQGDWGTDYEIEGVIYRHPSLANQVNPSHEVEMWFRLSDGATTLNGYEVMVNSAANTNLGHWHAPLDVDTPATSGPGIGASEVVDGDVVRARVVGDTITVWHNDVQAWTFDLNSHSPKYTTGNPGIGFFTRPSSGGHSDYFGFKSVTITKL